MTKNTAAERAAHRVREYITENVTWYSSTRNKRVVHLIQVAINEDRKILADALRAIRKIEDSRLAQGSGYDYEVAEIAKAALTALKEEKG